MRSYPNPALMLVAMLLSSPALATFPIQPIDCELFDTQSVGFLDHYFGFGTELSYTDEFQPTIATGFEGFMASPEQVAQIPDFVNGADLPTGGQSLEDLFSPPITPPPFVQDAAIWQSIEGEGSFGGGFSKVTLNQRKLFDLSQEFTGFVNVFGQGKGYAPFYPMGETDDPIDVRMTIDLFSYFDVDGSGSVSEGIAGALINVTDTENPMFVDGVSGFYFTDDEGVFSSFTRGEEGETDVSESFFTGPENAEPDARDIASFLYTIETQLMPGNTYGLGLFGDGAADVDGPGTALLSSTNTLSVSIEVLTPGATLLLPGGIVPEPATGALALLALLASLHRRDLR
ncbi:hypothetical protein MalM25_10470 [Planctomycetes bacterium MalM25]|nr:hypothetical protein MalM25_10470 [Planctomycetes bacterium MalM25]